MEVETATHSSFTLGAPAMQQTASFDPQVSATGPQVPGKRGPGRPRKHPGKYNSAPFTSPIRPASAPTAAPGAEATDNCIEVASPVHVHQNNQNFQLNHQIPSSQSEGSAVNSTVPRTKIKLFRSSKPAIAPRKPNFTASLLPKTRRVTWRISRKHKKDGGAPRSRLATVSSPGTNSESANPNVSDAKIVNGNFATPRNASNHPNASALPAVIPRPAAQQLQARPHVRFEDDVIQSHFDKINASVCQVNRLIEEAETGFPPETVYMVVHDYVRSVTDRRLHMTAFVHLKSANDLALEIFTKLYLPHALRRHPDFTEVFVEDLGSLPPGHLVWAVDYEGDGCLSLVWSEENFCSRVYVYRQKVERSHTAGTVELGGPQNKMEFE